MGPGVLQSRSFASVACTFSNTATCFLKDLVSSVVLLQHSLQLPFPAVGVMSLVDHSLEFLHQAFCDMCRYRLLGLKKI